MTHFNMDNETIAAIATAPGNSGIGVIRISGDKAIEIADSIIVLKDRKKADILKQESHTVKYGFVFDGKDMIDEVLVSVFKKPRSYTAEDTVEISCHGGTYILRRVLSLIMEKGARPAEPGEFTKRAFMNGRIDLTEAEAVMDVISSGNEFARKNSLSILTGAVHEKIVIMREKILHETAFIESALDDPEHYSLEGYPERLKLIINELISSLEKMISDSDTGRVLKEGIRTAIAGKPNVGKSSILNLLSGENKAIVTDIPGTTRDIVSSEVSLSGIPIILFDTAGIRETEDTVEKIGVERSRESIDLADLILFTVDSSGGITEEDREIYDFIKANGKKCIILKNKTDLKGEDPDTSYFTDPVIEFSAKTEKGLSELKKKIEEYFLSGEVKNSEDIYITNVRQINELRYAQNSLLLVKKSIEEKMTEDFFTVDLMDAYSHLGNIIGEDTDEDLFDRIFSEFCMGK